MNDVRAPVDEQIEWLLAERPRYLLTYPTMLDAIARRCAERALRLDFIDRLSSFGEVLDPAVRDRCRRVLGLEIVDSCSAQETGVLTSQCPEQGAQHVASESVLVEVLDERGRRCRPGRVGRIVVTCLHNFASPLIRYDIGDHAEAGRPCACGRGLPVLARIMGRSRNMVVLPDGTRRWPFASTMEFAAHDAIRQLQIVQKSVDVVEARLVVGRELTGVEQAAFVKALRRALRHPFRVELRFVDEIARGAGGKYEDFLCEIPPSG